MSTPTRQTSEVDLNTFNQQFRQTPMYADYMRSIGVDPSRPIHLSEQQAEGFERYLASHGVPVPQGMKIDPAGNFNQTNTLGKKVAITAAIAGATLATMGAAGVFSAAAAPALAGGGSAAAGGAAATGAAGVAGAAGAAGTAGTVATAAGSGAGFFGTVGKFLTSPGGAMLANTAGNLVATGIQANAANHASDASAQAAREALQFEKDVYGKDVKDFEPFQALSPQVAGKMGDYLNQARPAPRTAEDIFSSGQLPPGGSMTLGQMRNVGSGQTPAAAAMQPAERMVTVQSPDGRSQRQVPQSQADHWVTYGARVVG